jgi:predicted DNA-binding transcriptional regulator YafY
MGDTSSTMLETSARLLRLLSLLQSRRFWSGAQLADELEVTERSVRRDVDRLRSLGYPVQGTAGVAGGYTLGAGGRMPPLLLEEDEATAVAVGLRIAAAGPVSGMEEVALRALAKLEQLLPTRIRKRVSTLHGAVVSLPSSAPRVDAEVLTLIATASRDQQQLQFSYGDRKQRATTRQVEPHGVVHMGTRWYLVAFDVDREDFRTFRIDRVTSKPRLGKRFATRPIPHGDLATYVTQSVGVESYSQKARVLFHAPMAQLAQRIPASAGRLSEVSATQCMLETGGNDLFMLGMHLASTEVDFEVIEPRELVEVLGVLAERFQRAHMASSAREKRG